MPKAGAGGAVAKKARAPKGHKLAETFPPGEVLLQPLAKKKWQLGDVIGQGGFGLIYKASDTTSGPASSDPPYVIKIEPFDNGPLFCELHFYQRVAKPANISQWTNVKKLRYLGVPPFGGTGMHNKRGNKFRYLVMPRLSTDLQKIFEENGRSFSEKSVCSVGLRMLDALEFIHDKEYCHADIKAANILLGYHNGKQDVNQVFLVDYGLAYRYIVDGTHKPYKEDPRRAHDGTAEYASRDAHKGVYPSRRGDLEILGYCMLEWLAGTLPWSKDISNKDKVRDLKIRYMNDLTSLVKDSFGTKPCPEGLKKYLAMVSKLAYDEKPDYTKLRQFLRPGASNEWTLGLPDGTSQTKKRKSDAGDGPSPQKKMRAGSSPVKKPAASKAKAKASKTEPNISNGSATPTPQSRKRKATTPRATPKASPRASPKASPRASPTASKAKIPGAGGGRGRPAKVSPAVATSKSPAARKTAAKSPKSPAARKMAAKSPKSPAARKMAAKSPKSPKSPAARKTASSPGRRAFSAAKVKARTPQKASPAKRKRNKKTTVSDTAVQTSPGFALMSNGQY